MKILAIESSCDETAVAITRNGREVLADEIFSQADMHALYGGVVPEIASRNHITVISKLAESALKKAGVTKKDIDAVAVTYAPGLIGALLVGVNFAKGAAMMTETEVTIKQVAAYSNTIANDVINERYETYLDQFLPLDYTEEELEYDED